MAITKLNICNDFCTPLVQFWNNYPAAPKISEETYTIYSQDSQQMQVVFTIIAGAQ